MDESCFPYIGKNSPCGVPQNCRRVYTAEYGYVGGFYGGCSEMAMMLELVKNGPMGVAFEVKSCTLFANSQCSLEFDLCCCQKWPLKPSLILAETPINFN